MAVYGKHKIVVSAWEDSARKNAIYAPDDKLAEIQVNNMQHASGGVVTVEDSSSFNLPLPDIADVRMLFLKSDQDISVTINGAADPIELLRPSEGTLDAPTYCHLFIEGSITSVVIDKAASTPAADAHVRYYLWGDPQ
jgi:hypothetical protein